MNIQPIKIIEKYERNKLIYPVKLNNKAPNKPKEKGKGDKIDILA